MTQSATGGGAVLVDYDGNIATITNNKPEKRNAFDDDMDQELLPLLPT